MTMNITVAVLARPAKRAAALFAPRTPRRPQRPSSTPPPASASTPDVWLAGLRLGG
ncbi:MULTISPECIES: hypothetical protein [unclassified Streptomyces]|uniref:hypothetical protein n=1 Tax=unclassified Streptomyces TaxID=2593676 RepID=UPI0033B292B4